ncbi:phosphatidate cytidylyltransferase [Candidatus Igneacidithiobacillus taiwanensis]|uniref:phosphatidate cytidylyltransferase n=1 Tax=Candidatus Igneacidithiobacillus taiwanensis TaxID=1945924 RepID=UPI00289EE894|nr:phosphatidate cytidylyltransferase [Candidatus Igneacidithiobacillus taiwanensis]MCE5361467.1 phosphatidate cytidylyltransferase [Acidithiobacillus sp.]
MRQRLITATLLLAVFLPLLLYSPVWLFFSVLVLVFILAAGEWWQLSGVRHPRLWQSAAAFTLLLLTPLLFELPDLPIYVAGASTIFWACTLVLLIALRRRGTLSPGFLAVAGFPALIPAFALGIWLQGRQPLWLLWGIGIVILTDVFAMLAGKRFGRARLAPMLSPGKTWAGLWGGLLGGVLGGTLGAGLFWSWQPAICLAGAGIGIVVATFGVAGDLFESLLKRSAGQKDSGQLLPGHGGVLDRLDALTAGLPVFISLLFLWGKL